jgi:hypothetical protein
MRGLQRVAGQMEFGSVGLFTPKRQLGAGSMEVSWLSTELGAQRGCGRAACSVRMTARTRRLDQRPATAATCVSSRASLLSVDVVAALHGKLEGDVWTFGVCVFEQYIVELLVVRESPAWDVQKALPILSAAEQSGWCNRKARRATESALV